MTPQAPRGGSQAARGGRGGRGGGASSGGGRQGLQQAGGKKGTGAQQEGQHGHASEKSQFAKYVRAKLDQALGQDPDKKKKLVQYMKSVQEAYNRASSKGMSSNDFFEMVVDTAHRLSPNTRGVNFVERFREEREASLAAANAHRGDAGGKQQKRSAPTGSNDPNAKRVRFNSEAPRGGLKKKGAAVAQGASHKDAAQSAQAPQQAARGGAGSTASAASQQQSTPGTGDGTGGGAGGRPGQPQMQAGAAPQNAAKPGGEGKKEEKKKQSDDDFFDAVKSAGIDVEGEEDLMGLLTQGQDDYVDSIVQETDLLSHPILRQKLETVASRYNLDGVSRDCAECLSLAVRERLSNFLDTYLRVGDLHAETEKEKWALDKIAPVEAPIRDELSSASVTTSAAQENTSKGEALRDCLFVVDHDEKAACLVAQSMRWHSRLHDMSSSVEPTPDNYVS